MIRSLIPFVTAAIITLPVTAIIIMVMQLSLSRFVVILLRLAESESEIRFKIIIFVCFIGKTIVACSPIMY